MPNPVKPRWAMNERDVTPEALFRSRRAIVKAAGFGLAGAGIAGPAHAGFFDNLFGGGGSAPAPDAETDPSAGLYPAPRNAEFSVAQPITDERLATSYNNFYEFGSHKEIAKAAQALPIRPWTVTLDGMVEAEQTLDIDDLLGRVALQERVYRFRCVETWSMVVPWTGFPLADLVAIARPSAGARYVRMETFLNPEVAPGQRQSWYPWPYVEGLTMEEATHPLTMMVTGAYGKPLEEQNGAPIRLIVPWKYGFKSVKSVVRLTFTDERPQTFWMDLAGDEYGFFANVNPEVAHPRWSQAMEQPLGQDERVPTLLYNGYAEEVAGLYSGTTEKIFF